MWEPGFSLKILAAVAMLFSVVTLKCQCQWLVVNIYLAALRLGKYPPLATSTLVNSCYPNTLVNSTIHRFMQETDRAPHAVTSSEPSVYIKLPFKDQRSADRVRKEIISLGSMINVNVKPVFTSRKLSQTLSVKENRPPIVNTQCVVYSFQCDLCDANYVGFTARHLHQRISEHRYSAIPNTLKHNMTIKEQRSITSLKS